MVVTRMDDEDPRQSPTLRLTFCRVQIAVMDQGAGGFRFHFSLGGGGGAVLLTTVIGEGPG